MRTLFISITALCCLVAGIVVSCSDEPTKSSVLPGQIKWASSSVVYDTTIDKKDHSLIFFLASWCGWCKKLKNETLTNAQVIADINASFNAVQIDPDADTMVVYHDSTVSCGDLTGTIYGVSAFPTVVVCDRRGNEISRATGYRDAAAFAQWLHDVLTIQ